MTRQQAIEVLATETVQRVTAALHENAEETARSTGTTQEPVTPLCVWVEVAEQFSTAGCPTNAGPYGEGVEVLAEVRAACWKLLGFPQPQP